MNCRRIDKEGFEQSFQLLFVCGHLLSIHPFYFFIFIFRGLNHRELKGKEYKKYLLEFASQMFFLRCYIWYISSKCRTGRKKILGFNFIAKNEWVFIVILS